MPASLAYVLLRVGICVMISHQLRCPSPHVCAQAKGAGISNTTWLAIDFSVACARFDRGAHGISVTVLKSPTSHQNAPTEPDRSPFLVARHRNQREQSGLRPRIVTVLLHVHRRFLHGSPCPVNASFPGSEEPTAALLPIVKAVRGETKRRRTSSSPHGASLADFSRCVCTLSAMTPLRMCRPCGA